MNTLLSNDSVTAELSGRAGSGNHDHTATVNGCDDEGDLSGGTLRKFEENQDKLSRYQFVRGVWDPHDFRTI